MNDSNLGPVDSQFTEILRLKRFVGDQRFLEIHQHIWEPHAPQLRDWNGTEPDPLKSLWRLVLDALRGSE